MSAFILYPAIDVRGGRVVRLSQGDYARETRYADDPVAVAQGYAGAGATWPCCASAGAAAASRQAARNVATVRTGLTLPPPPGARTRR